MDPFTWIAIASALVSAAGTYYTGVKQKQAAEYNAKVAENQADIEEQESRERIRRMREEAKAFMARQLSMRANSGVSIETGSSLLVAAETASRLELQALEQSRSDQARLYALRTGAEQSRMQGDTALKSAYWQSGASLLAGLGQAGASYQQSFAEPATYQGVKLNTKRLTIPKNSSTLAFSTIDPTRIV